MFEDSCAVVLGACNRFALDTRGSNESLLPYIGGRGRTPVLTDCPKGRCLPCEILAPVGGCQEDAVAFSAGPDDLLLSVSRAHVFCLESLAVPETPGRSSDVKIQEGEGRYKKNKNWRESIKSLKGRCRGRTRSANVFLRNLYLQHNKHPFP